MAINKITAGLASGPGAFAQPVLNQLQTLVNSSDNSQRWFDGYVRKGARFNIGGSLFLADENTAITGTESDYVKLTVSGTVATPSYSPGLTGVSWNSEYNGYYDSSDNLYIFDELKAYNAGTISTTYALTGTDLFAFLQTGAAGTYSVATVPTSGYWIIPAGLYMMIARGVVTSLLILQIEDASGTWVGGSDVGGLVLSDGVHFRIKNWSGDYAEPVYYRKLL